MKVHAVRIGGQGGIIEEAESKVVCPYCTRFMPMEEFEAVLYRSKDIYIRKKCKGCKKFIGIVGNMEGDFIGFEL